VNSPGLAVRASPGTVLLGAALALVALSAWWMVVRDAQAMVMPGHAAPTLAEGALFTAQWGVMMAAMMLPSAMPMLLLYRMVSRKLASQRERVIPAWMFAAVYLLVWLAIGVPLYGAHLAVASAAARWPAFDAMLPYGVALVIASAGVYQFTAAKRACLGKCESPLEFLMQRFRSGYASTLRLALSHSAYCLGCCWGLMAILVAAGAMSLPWVVAITIVVFAEKVLPRGWMTARVVGVVLLVLAGAVVLRPGLAGTMRGGGHAHSGEMPMMPGMAH
jgi:predicted metal-binding membrane protein